MGRSCLSLGRTFSYSKCVFIHKVEKFPSKERTVFFLGKFLVYNYLSIWPGKLFAPWMEIFHLMNEYTFGIRKCPSQGKKTPTQFSALKNFFKVDSLAESDLEAIAE